MIQTYVCHFKLGNFYSKPVQKPRPFYVNHTVRPLVYIDYSRPNSLYTATNSPYNYILDTISLYVKGLRSSLPIELFRFGCVDTRSHSVAPIAHNSSLKAAYQKSLKEVTMSGPICFQPIIDSAVSSLQPDYFTLAFILLSGRSNSPSQDALNLIRASNSPILFIILYKEDFQIERLKQIQKRRFQNVLTFNFTKNVQTLRDFLEENVGESLKEIYALKMLTKNGENETVEMVQERFCEDV
ncbi:Copine_I [Hexamita inflata]|uniref:Copine I n=1 Tax=Hexamita inflata TaxID=28002 RepID=A0AA86R8X0_9EUKA|nr:Copine I [Hexamita inflata]